MFRLLNSTLFHGKLEGCLSETSIGYIPRFQLSVSSLSDPFWHLSLYLLQGGRSRGSLGSVSATGPIQALRHLFPSLRGSEEYLEAGHTIPLHSDHRLSSQHHYSTAYPQLLSEAKEVTVIWGINWETLMSHSLKLGAGGTESGSTLWLQWQSHWQPSRLILRRLY